MNSALLVCMDVNIQLKTDPIAPHVSCWPWQLISSHCIWTPNNQKPFYSHQPSRWGSHQPTDTHISPLTTNCVIKRLRHGRIYISLQIESSHDFSPHFADNNDSASICKLIWNCLWYNLLLNRLLKLYSIFSNISH